MHNFKRIVLFFFNTGDKCGKMNWESVYAIRVVLFLISFIMIPVGLSQFNQNPLISFIVTLLGALLLMLAVLGKMWLRNL